jgi:hypothetical protein
MQQNYQILGQKLETVSSAVLLKVTEGHLRAAVSLQKKIQGSHNLKLSATQWQSCFLCCDIFWENVIWISLSQRNKYIKI